jgi:hypothetical protein
MIYDFVEAIFRGVGKLYKQTMEINSPWRAIT